MAESLYFYIFLIEEETCLPEQSRIRSVDRSAVVEVSGKPHLIRGVGQH